MLKKRLRTYMQIGLVTLAALLPAKLHAQETVRFDYSSTSGTATTKYDTQLIVILNNVNTLDYRYKISIAAQPPTVKLPGGLFPTPLPARGAGIAAAAPPTQTDRDACKAALEKRLADRRKLFGSESLITWNADLDPAKCTNAELREAIKDHFKGVDLAGAGTLAIPRTDLESAIRQTAPGGSVVITVNATALKSSVTITNNNEISTQQAPLAENELEEAEKAHMAERKFQVNFGPPRGVTFAIGPFVTSLQRKEFARVQNREHDPEDEESSELVVGMTEDSDYTYGVAAYWNAPLTTSGKWGISWGVGFNAQSELEESISGLIGAYWRPLEDSPAQISFGAAVGSVKDLDDGWDPGDPIGASQEIPTTTELKVKVFLGISFRFGD